MKVTLRAHFDFQQRLDRRTLLKGAGVSMAMPWLSAMDSTFGASTKQGAEAVRRNDSWSGPACR